MQDGKPAHVLIAGVGYSFLRDFSVGPRLAAELKKRTWPPGVEIDDWSFGPLDAMHNLQYAQPPYDRVVFFGAVQRSRPVGTVVRRQWDRSQLPSPEVLQERVGEAISGVISLDNLVFLCGGFDALPEDTVLLELEPDPDETSGEEYSREVTAALPKLVSYIEREAGVLSTVAGDIQRQTT